MRLKYMEQQLEALANVKFSENEMAISQSSTMLDTDFDRVVSEEYETTSFKSYTSSDEIDFKSKGPHAIGILTLSDYPDPGFALGDVGNKSSFDCPVYYEAVEGLTFEMAQQGYKTD
jgi:hypothetical protein